MGLAMEDGKVGSLVWVLRKNGTWWPGKVLCLNEISSLDQFSSPSVIKTPIKLLGRENGSVEWYNLEKSKRVKAFGSVESGGFIKKAVSNHASPSKKCAIEVCGADAILHALQLQKEELEKCLKSRGNVQQGALCRAKRSRCVYLPVESSHNAEHSVLHSRSMNVFPIASATEEHYQKSSLPAEKASSKSTISDFSGSSFDDYDGDGVKQHTGSYGNRRQKRSMDVQKEDNLSYSPESSVESKIVGDGGVENRNLTEKPHRENLCNTPDIVTNGKCSAASRKRTRNIQDLLTLDVPCQEKRGYGIDTKSGEHLAQELKNLFDSTSGGNSLQDSDSLSLGPVYTNHQNRMETMLMDVDLTVQANYRKEHVPLVSLMSKLNKKAIIGHPIEVEALEDNPEVFLVRKDTKHNMVDHDDSKIHQLVWRTSKRTPVCYITNSSSPVTDEKGEHASKTHDNSNLEARGNNIPQAEESLWKPLKKGNISQNNEHDLQITSQSAKEVGRNKQGGSILQEATCVPVKLIFTKLFFAVGI